MHQEKFTDVGWWQKHEDLWLDLILDQKIEKTSAIIDIGAGASLLLDALFEEGFTNLSALDISTSAISRLKERFDGDSEKMTFYVGDVLSFRPQKKFRIWYDRAVFHFLMDPEEQKLYSEVAARNVEKGGNLIIATFAPNGPEKCSGLPVLRHSEESLSSVFAANFKLDHADQRIHVTPSGVDQPFTICVFTRI